MNTNTMEILSYCEKCPYFDAKLEVIGINNKDKNTYDFSITCDNIEICNRVAQITANKIYESEYYHEKRQLDKRKH